MPPRMHAAPPCNAPAQIRKNATTHQHPRKRRERSPSERRRPENRRRPSPPRRPKRVQSPRTKAGHTYTIVAYRRIREQRTRTTSSSATTKQNIQMVRQAIAAYGGSQETGEAIWKGIRRQPIHTRVQQSLDKAIHGTQKIGDF